MRTTFYIFPKTKPHTTSQWPPLSGPMRRIENFLVTFLATCLVSSPIRLALGHERLQNLVEHEIDKRSALAGGGRGADCLVVFLLVRPAAAISAIRFIALPLTL